MNMQQLLLNFKPKQEMSKEVVETTITNLERKYETCFTPTVKLILQLGAVSFGQVNERKARFMGLHEIVNADEFLHIDFTMKQLLPLFDLMDNDFICFHVKDESYYVFNIIDETLFFKSSMLEDLVNKL